MESHVEKAVHGRIAAERAPGARSGVGWWRRYRRLALLTALLLLAGAGENGISGMPGMRLARAAVHCGRASAGLSSKLQCLVANGVGRGARSIELAVAKGDGSFSWAGAAGTANEHGARMATNTPIYIASVTKIYVATTVMALAERGMLALDDPIARYLPAALLQGLDVYRGHDYSQAVTIRELVSMTSGIPDYYEERGRDGKTLFELLIANPAKPWTVDEMIGRARTHLTAHFPPGAAVYYSDTGYQLLGLIIESVTHQSLGRALEDHIFGPLGLQRTWLIGGSAPGPTGAAAPADVYYGTQNISVVRAHDYWADGGIVSTAPEMITFLRALRDGRLVSGASLSAMQAWRDGTMPGPPGTQYGYGLWHFRTSGPLRLFASVLPTWGATGSTGSFLYYSHDLDLFMAGTVNSASSDLAPFVLMAGVMSLVGSHDNPARR
ncbi:MAG TPA: serine hydrolase domain-containing protein [Candidatus Methylomirabilis sp.]|nr:serine hydrolase domain-containing protein [Candidatus Methylomirabilis sp.]